MVADDRLNTRIRMFLAETLRGHPRYRAIELSGVDPTALKAWLARSGNRNDYQRAVSLGVAMHPEVHLLDAICWPDSDPGTRKVSSRPPRPRDCEVVQADGSRCNRVTRRGMTLCRRHLKQRFWEDVVAGKARPPWRYSLRSRCRACSPTGSPCNAPACRGLYVILPEHPGGELHVWPDWCDRHAWDPALRAAEIDRLAGPDAAAGSCGTCHTRFGFTGSEAPKLCPACDSDLERDSWVPPAGL